MIKKLGSYVNGNFVSTIYSDGTKVRENDLEFFKSAFPENIDIKISNRCDMGCPMCHEKSSINGKNADLKNLEFIDTLRPYTELACLSGETIVYNKKGSIEIENLSVGDEIFDSEGILRKIINISKIEKKAFLLKGDKGFNSICSEDHPFMSYKNKIMAKDMIGRTIDFFEGNNFIENKEDIYIDLSPYIKENNPILEGSRGGKDFNDGTIRLRNSTKPVNKKIKLTEDIMWLYGVFIAEGSKRGFVFGSTEMEYAEKVKRIWRETFNLDCSIRKNKNSIIVEPFNSSLLEDFFGKALEVKSGSRNHRLSYLFTLDNSNLVKHALLGLFDGDGCYRTRKSKTNNTYSANLKTTSKYLAYDTSFILAKYFNIHSSIHYGISKERVIEGRTLKESDYYSVNIYNREDINKIFSDRFIMKDRICNKIVKKENKIRSIEQVKNQILYDLTLDEGSHVFPINGYFLTHNCGGGNIFENPQLEAFLLKLKDRKIIANITVNQKHFMDNLELLKAWQDEKLFYGIGISLVDSNEKFLDEVEKFPNAVIHVINGVVTPAQLFSISHKTFKILILGYKDFGRGTNYHLANSYEINKNMDFLYYNLEFIRNNVKVLSFDNLAITQLDPKRLLTEEQYKEFYMGDDGQFTMYIDAVERKFAKNSTATVRYDLTDNIDGMFQIIKGEI